MNLINTQLCKELWNNFDKCDWEAWLTEPSAMLVFVHSPSLHTRKGARGGRSMGLGVSQAEGRAEAGGLSNRTAAVL